MAKMTKKMKDMVAIGDLAKEFADDRAFIKDIKARQDERQATMKGLLDAHKVDKVDTGPFIVQIVRGTRSTLVKEKLLECGVAMAIIRNCTDTKPTTSFRVDAKKEK